MVNVRYGPEYSEVLLASGTVVEFTTREGVVTEAAMRSLIGSIVSGRGRPAAAVLTRDEWIILKRGVTFQYDRPLDAVVEIVWDPDGSAGWSDD
jgi:hypothetical protein